jgi:hypothetical protein
MWMNVQQADTCVSMSALTHLVVTNAPARRDIFKKVIAAWVSLLCEGQKKYKIKTLCIYILNNYTIRN